MANGHGQCCYNLTPVLQARDAIRAVLKWASAAELGDQFSVPDSAACVSTPTGTTALYSTPSFCNYRDPSMAPAVIATINNTCPDLYATVGSDGLVSAGTVKRVRRVL